MFPINLLKLRTRQHELKVKNLSKRRQCNKDDLANYMENKKGNKKNIQKTTSLNKPKVTLFFPISNSVKPGL